MEVLLANGADVHAKNDEVKIFQSRVIVSIA